jgi:uncharacterized protein YcaQ
LKTLRDLRVLAITRSLFPATTLKQAISKLGFVQADPIRSPARAQDLILRQRVKNYHAGDLERRYESLDIEEDVLYAYGFVPRATWQMIHPRKLKGLSMFEKKVLALVRDIGETHPRELEAHLGNERVINAWGGYSKATTQALEDLHYRGLVRIARRENGIRIYSAISKQHEPLALHDRLSGLIMLMAAILAPCPEQTLYSNITRFRRLGEPRATVQRLIKSGELQRETIEGLSYLWPKSHEKSADEAAPIVRLLAPFDPLVWDRRRFEHFWGWQYRFEAYTPAAKRIRGYYALPLLWRDAVVGWANANITPQGLIVSVGYVQREPDEKAFRGELDAEVARLAEFLREKSGTASEF